MLRHAPETLGLRLDSGGWVRVQDLVAALRARRGYAWVGKEHIEAVAHADPKGRFELRGQLIRARYGHTKPVTIEYGEHRGSAPLYHGTTEEAWGRISCGGLLPGSRLWVHLSTSMKDAYETGRRHGGKVAVLEVDAKCLREHGIKVYAASSRVKLVKYVPQECMKRIF